MHPLLVPDKESTAHSPGSSVFDLPTERQGQPTRTANLSCVFQPHSLASDEPPKDAPRPSFLIISGGTGGNAICAAFGDTASYVLPVSDDGGSSSEIIRVLGGPSIGDIRSRLVRLIPSAAPASPLCAIRGLLSYRLPADCSEQKARDEWREIVEGRSWLWAGIPNDRKEAIRGFLVSFESELLKRAHKKFSFLNGSIGNYFLAAAQAFFRSLPSAIFLFSSITNSQANILPTIVTNHTVTIAAELENGENLVGQCEISHPVRVRSTRPSISINTESPPLPPIEDDGLKHVLWQGQNVMFDPQAKGQYDTLASRISRVYYINVYGQEVHPSPNPDYLSSLSSKDVLIYACGSLWTSIIPCLALQGVAKAIVRSRSLRAKVLLLNSKNDRETDGYTAVDYIQAIARTLNADYVVRPNGTDNVNKPYPISAFITHLVHLRGAAVQVDTARVTSLGVKCVEVDGEDAHGVPMFNADCVRCAVNEILVRDE